MAWLSLLVAGLLEIGWAFGLKESDGFTRLWPSVATAAALGLSFFLFARAIRSIEVGTAYAVFTGIGTAGTVVVGILFLGEPVDLWRLFFVALLIGGIVGLKMIAADAPRPAVAGGEPASACGEPAAACDESAGSDRGLPAGGNGGRAAGSVPEVGGSGPAVGGDGPAIGGVPSASDGRLGETAFGGDGPKVGGSGPAVGGVPSASDSRPGETAVAGDIPADKAPAAEAKLESAAQDGGARNEPVAAAGKRKE